MSTRESRTAEAQRRFPWRFLIPVPLLLIGLGWWGLHLPLMRLEQVRERLEAELTESSARAEVIAIAGSPSYSMSVAAADGTVEREGLAYGPDRTWFAELTQWVKLHIGGTTSLFSSAPRFEVRWHEGRCLGVSEAGAPWPDNTPGVEWPSAKP